MTSLKLSLDQVNVDQSLPAYSLDNVFNSTTDFHPTDPDNPSHYELKGPVSPQPAMPTGGISNPPEADTAYSQLGDPLFSYESPPLAYPNISFPVALRVSQQYPDVVWRASNSYTNTSGVSTPPPPAALDLLPSPLRAMARTSGNLALQQSTIGTGKGSLSSSAAVSEESGTLSRSESSSSVSSPERKEMLRRTSLQGVSSLQSSPVISGEQRKTYPFVPTHRSSKLSDDVLVRLEADRRGCNGRSSCARNNTGSQTGDCDSFHPVPNFKKTWASYNQEHNQQLPPDSVHSETESNFSSISGIEEEMHQVKKLLIPVRDCITIDTGTQTTCNLVPETNDTQIQCKMTPEHKAQTDSNFNLLREKVNLGEQLTALREELELVKGERDNFSTALSSTEAQVQSLTCAANSIQQEKQNLEDQLRRAETEKQQWKGVIEEYQAAVEAKGQEVKALREDLAQQEVNGERLKIDLQEQKVDLEAKDGAIRGLKQKIAELHVEVQVLAHDKIHLESNVKNLAADAETLQKSKEWYTEQLHGAQESRNTIHQELIELQSKHGSAVATLEQIQNENSRLKHSIMESRQKTVREKEVLMKHLENIEADMLEREAIFQQAERDKGNAEQLISARLKRMDEEQSKVTQLRLKASDLEQQVESLQQDLSGKDEMITAFEAEKNSLASQLLLLHRQKREGAFGVNQLREEAQNLEKKVGLLSSQLRTRDQRISELSAAKTAAEVALSSINSEKRTIDEALKQMKENFNKVERNFKQIRADLVEKASKLEQLTRENIRLEETLQQTENNLLHQKLTFDAQSSSQTFNSDVQMDDLRKQNQEIERVVTLLKHELRVYEKKLADVMEENESHKQQKLLNDRTYSNAKPRCDESMEEEIEALKNQMNESEVQFRDRKRVYESNIKVLTRKLKEVMKDVKKKERDLAALKASVVLPEKSNTETQTDEPVENGEVASVEEMSALQQLVSDLKLEVANKKELLDSTQKTILELEKENGSLKVLGESQEGLRHRVTLLESSLSERESLLAMVSQQTGEVQRKAQEETTRGQDVLRQAQADLAKEKALVKELRHQVFQEKREARHLRHQLSGMTDSLGQSGQTCDSLNKEITSLKQELELGCERERRLSTEVQSSQAEALHRTLQVKTLQGQLDEVKARDPALAQQHKALSWHLKEKTQELASFKEQLRMLEERSSTEAQALRAQTKETLTEIEDLKVELVSTRKEKFKLQSVVTELKGLLQSTVQTTTKNMHGHILESGDVSLHVSIPESPAPCDESLIQSLLQKSLSLPESRPLNNLQACLNSLKQEMATLQKQIEEQGLDQNTNST